MADTEHSFCWHALSIHNLQIAGNDSYKQKSKQMPSLIGFFRSILTQIRLYLWRSRFMDLSTTQRHLPTFQTMVIRDSSLQYSNGGRLKFRPPMNEPKSSTLGIEWKQKRKEFILDIILISRISTF